jgi:hypothetical protein
MNTDQLKKNKFVILGGLIVLYFILKKFFGSAGDEARSQQQVLDSVLQESQQNQQQQTFDDSVYASTANLIQTLLDGPEMVGTELQVVDEVIKVVANKKDWQKLQLSFGRRDIKDATYFSSTNYTLSQLLRDQLDSYEVYWSIDNNNWKQSGWGANTGEILAMYFNKINIQL